AEIHQLLHRGHRQFPLLKRVGTHRDKDIPVSPGELHEPPGRFEINPHGEKGADAPRPGGVEQTIEITAGTGKVYPVEVAVGVDQHGSYQRLWVRRSVVSRDRKSTRLNSSHVKISYAVFCLKKKRQSIQ